MSNIDQMIQNAQQAALSVPSNTKLEMIVTDYTYDEYISAGHNDETLVRDNLAKLVPAGPAGPAGPASPASPQAASPASPASPQIQQAVSQSPVAYQAPNAQVAVVDPALLAPVDMSMDSLMAQGFTVDAWVKTGFHGLALDDVLCEDFTATILMVSGQGFKTCHAIRFGANPVNYDKTFDGVSAEDGSPWASKVMAAKGIDPKCRPYRSVQVAMELLDDIVSVKDGKVLAKAGSIIGYATSVTGWGEWESFYRSCTAQNVMGSHVTVTVSNISKDKGSNQWGVLRWEIFADETVVSTQDQEELTEAESEAAEAKLATKGKAKAKK